MRESAADSTMPFSRPSTGGCESLGWTLCSHEITTSRTLCTSSSGGLPEPRLLFNFRRHFTTRELATASLSSVPNSRRRLYAVLRWTPFRSITHDRFSVLRMTAPLSMRFVHDEYCRFRNCSFSSPLKVGNGSDSRHSLEAQNSSRSSTSGWQRSAQPSWPKYIRIACTKASAMEGASAAAICLTRSFKFPQRDRKSSPPHCTSC
mmetsp:Transcript_65792/g.186811  ORF Transcript_65792/g.186811 Transcript_65792/m.186811 type:complete len:205 (-) Transcript_65792:3317-3931(-)